MYREDKKDSIYYSTVEDAAGSSFQKEEAGKKRRSRGTGKKAARLVAGALVFGLVAGTSFQGVNLAAQKLTANQLSKSQEKEDSFNNSLQESQIQTGTTADLSISQVAADNSTSVSQIVENAMPSIVAINCSALTKSNMFGREFVSPTEGSGSGIIIGQNQKEILIATNNHVVAGDNAQVEIIFCDESSANAEIKGTDASNDLAVVAVSLDDLSEETKKSIKIATLGDSDSVKVGEMAIAIGNALGYGQSVTVGYISATERKISVEDATMTLLQTDAAINPGNSGGALLNASGEVIGINSVKMASTEVEGIGYAIPISKAVPIITDLMNREELDESERAYLGIRGDNVTEEYSRFYMPIGVFVGEVTEDSPAEKAGLKAGNIIVGIEGRTIKTMEELQNYLTYTKAGTKVTMDIKVMDNGAYKDAQIEVTLGSRPE